MSVIRRSAVDTPMMTTSSTIMKHLLYDDIKYWIFDLPVSLMMLACLSPVILVILGLVKLTSAGPVFYTQRRLGRNRRPFTIYKIRSMYEDSEKNGPKWCSKNDPRITPIGKLLRWSHFDELPQLWNIMKGEMSLVGPRPERPEIAGPIERTIPHYGERLRVRPGLTGLAQVQQAPDSNLYDVHCKLNYDLHYIQNMNLWLDLRIMFATWFYIAGIKSERIAKLFGFPGTDLHCEIDESLIELKPMTAACTH
jgi:lipopolysaccharide/colanic/teichoic acid biosynthesis glycosyltransferase